MVTGVEHHGLRPLSRTDRRGRGPGSDPRCPGRFRHAALGSAGVLLRATARGHAPRPARLQPRVAAKVDGGAVWANVDNACSSGATSLNLCAAGALGRPVRHHGRVRHGPPEQPSALAGPLEPARRTGTTGAGMIMPALYAMRAEEMALCTTTASLETLTPGHLRQESEARVLNPIAISPSWRAEEEFWRSARSRSRSRCSSAAPRWSMGQRRWCSAPSPPARALQSRSGSLASVEGSRACSKTGTTST